MRLVKKTLTLSLITISSITLLNFTNVFASKDQITAVGSGSVYPFMAIVSENFAKTSKMKAPVVEAIGTGGGIQQFCSSTSLSTPDFANASRRMKKEEYERCTKKGVQITEIKIGYDALVLAVNKSSGLTDLTKKDIFLAFAKQVPGNEGLPVKNPYKTWQDVNPTLPNTPIRVIGPQPTSGTRDSFTELVMVDGCLSTEFKNIIEKDKSQEKKLCTLIREDGAWIDGGENYQLNTRKVQQEKNSMTIFGFSFYENNKNAVKAVSIEGIAPSKELILSGKYPVSRDLYVYAKINHVTEVVGMKEFIAELVSPKAIGAKGYLVKRGLVPMNDEEFKKYSSDALSLKPMVLE